VPNHQCHWSSFTASLSLLSLFFEGCLNGKRREKRSIEDPLPYTPVPDVREGMAKRKKKRGKKSREQVSEKKETSREEKEIKSSETRNWV
jgi:hypothetical protein